jgi:hypothetical protein
MVIGASFQPQTVKVMTDAFDAAWATIADNFRGHPEQTEAARLALAQAVLSVASEDSTDVESLKNGALQAMAMDFRTLPLWSPENFKLRGMVAKKMAPGVSGPGPESHAPRELT